MAVGVRENNLRIHRHKANRIEIPLRVSYQIVSVAKLMGKRFYQQMTLSTNKTYSHPSKMNKHTMQHICWPITHHRYDKINISFGSMVTCHLCLQGTYSVK